MPTTTTNIFDRSIRSLFERHEELKPLVDEYHKIERALEGMVQAGLEEVRDLLGLEEPKPAKRMPPQKTKAAARPKAKPAPARRRGGAGDRLVALLQEAKQPMTMAEIVDQLGGDTRYTYRLAKKLTASGRIRKVGQTFLSATGESEPVAAESVEEAPPRRPVGSTRRRAAAQPKPRRATGTTRRSRPRGAVAGELVDLVERHPEGITGAAIARELGVHSKTAYRTAHKLRDAGRIDVAADGARYMPAKAHGGEERGASGDEE